MPDKSCFVVQGFGKKTDFESGRTLDLDASYEVIKEAVEEAGLRCVRADEIQHSGLIDKPMYEQILNADLVIADVSTSNLNAMYELGVRHALRPYTTIIVAEEGFSFAFDINRNLIRTYKHLGEDIGRKEAQRFKDDLRAAIAAILVAPEVDSPVYTFLPSLEQPRAAAASFADLPAAAPEGAAAEADEEGFSYLLKKFRAAKRGGDWQGALKYLEDIREMRPEDAYFAQQQALATYKAGQPDAETALLAARKILESLNPATTHDTETLGIWGAVHKRLWERHPGDLGHLSDAIWGYEKGFYLRDDYYNGINFAFMLNQRASVAKEKADAIADFVQARRVRERVIKICQERLAAEARDEGAISEDDRYWIPATLWEASVGVGDPEGAKRWEEAARKAATESWMVDGTEKQIAQLRALLASSPLEGL